MWAELRAYRRSIKLAGGDLLENAEKRSKSFTGYAYYWMWPFKADIVRRLIESSPYKEEMDKVTESS